MSLSARIAVRASRRLDVLAVCVASGGVAVVAFTAAHRWPGAAGGFAAVAIALPAALALIRVRSRSVVSSVLSVADRAEVAVTPDPGSGDGDWRLDDSTMMWPGFSVIGLRRESGATQAGGSMRVAVFDAELSAPDRRSLHRFLLWSLRGGQVHDASARGNAPR